MFPPMMKAPGVQGALGGKQQKPALDMGAVQLPGVEPLGGGPILPNPDGEMMGGRSAGPMMPEGPPMQATAAPMAMPKPQPQPQPQPQQGMVTNLNPGSPMPKPRPAKPQGAQNMPPMINAPQNPGYFPMQPGVREIQAPGAPQYQAQTPSVPGIAQQPANIQAPTVGAERASAGQFDVNAFRPFSDAVYSEATRQLDPMMQQREADFRQRMVNQGLQEGTEAYDKAFANFSRERNDAYGSARNQALAQALGAQNQFFGQSATNAQMANQMGLAGAQLGLQAQGMNLQDRNSLASLGLQAQGMGMQDRQFGANLGLNFAQLGQQAQAQNASNQLQAAGLGQSDRQFGANLGLQYGQLGQQAQLANAANWINQNQFGRSLNEQGRQFNENMGFGRERADMQDLMALLGYGQQTTNYNNSLLGMDQQRAGALFGLIPGLTPTQLDVMGAANMWNQQHMQGRQMQADARNGTMQAIGQLGGAALMMSDARMKTDVQKVGKLDNGLNVYSYRYTFGGPVHIGVMAQEVEAVNPRAVAEIDGIKHVDYTEAVK